MGLQVIKREAQEKQPLGSEPFDVCFASLRGRGEMRPKKSLNMIPNCQTAPTGCQNVDDRMPVILMAEDFDLLARPRRLKMQRMLPPAFCFSS